MSDLSVIRRDRAYAAWCLSSLLWTMSNLNFKSRRRHRANFPGATVIVGTQFNDLSLVLTVSGPSSLYDKTKLWPKLLPGFLCTVLKAFLGSADGFDH